MTPSLILASSSPWRRELLERLAVPFTQRDPAIDEATVKATESDPRFVALRLSSAKALAIARTEAGALVIGSDQVATIDGRILGKPLSFENACEQLRGMQGRTHELITGLAIADRNGRRCLTELIVARMHMRSLSDDQIRAYVRADDPLSCAGSYRLEARGIGLFEGIDCPDYTAIIGLPLMRTATLLNLRGVPIPAA